MTQPELILKLIEQLMAEKEKNIKLQSQLEEYKKQTESLKSQLEKEKEILKVQALNEGKPAAVVEKMVEGRIKKYYKDVVLMEQEYVRDPSKTISQLISDAVNKIGEKISIRRFVRYQMGEGLEKRKDDFAAEVMAAVNK